MSRQTEFFMDAKDQASFVEFVYSQGDILIKPMRDEQNNCQPINLRDGLTEYHYYISSPSLRLQADIWSSISSGEYEIIEFLLSQVKDNTIGRGRIYVETTLCIDHELTHQSEAVINKYEKYKKYIRKNYNISVDKHYYIGPGAYELYKQGWIMSYHIKHPMKHSVVFR